VEQIGYYEDSPKKDSEVEAISIDKLDDSYYKPFWNRMKLMKARATSNCSDIDSLYICSETRFCSWDALVKHCAFNENKKGGEVLSVRFRQKTKKGVKK
jgi:hypothetical protein